MKKIFELLILVLTYMLLGCGIFGPSKESNDTPKPVPQPPRKIANEDLAPKVNASEPQIAEKQAQIDKTIQPRIQEDRSIGGTIEQIKVNNKNMPDYYIYPSTEQNLNINNQPNKNVTTPSWQINW